MRGSLGSSLVVVLIACAPVRVPLESLHRVGRFSDDGRFTWSASRVSVKFAGSGKVRAVFRQLSRPASVEGPGQPLRLQVELDGAAEQLYASDAGELVFEQVVPPGTHRLTVVRQSEAMVGEARLDELELPPGARVEPWPAAPLVEFIGDSMSVGFGVEGDDPCPYSTKTQAVTAAFPWLVGLSLKADVRVVGWSGRGVVRNWGDRAEPTVPELWAPAQPEPGLVVIALGANDLWDGKLPEGFSQAYAALVARVRAAYAHAELVQIATDARAAVLPDALVLEAPPEKLGHGCVGHPSSQAQRWIADQVTARVCRTSALCKRP